jgi:hypothetical protein
MQQENLRHLVTRVFVEFGMDYRKPLIDPERVKARMDACGHSLSDLARLAEVNYQLLQNLFAGQYKVKNPTWTIGLTRPLNTSWEYLTGQTDNPAAPVDEGVKESLGNGTSNGGAHERKSIGREKPDMLNEITHMFGRLEGKLESKFEAIERRLTALEEGTLPRPPKGRRR